MNQQFRTFQENLLGLFQLFEDLVQKFQGSLTLVGLPVFKEVLVYTSRQFYKQ